MFRRIYWMFVVIELEAVYDVNRKRFCFIHTSECRAQEPIALPLKINCLETCLQTHCFYPLIALSLLYNSIVIAM